ncbi:MAG: hypothetical protein HOC20_01610, partial [Chloroflexi bacterium]|nr:hypothetical protein [Chloroflexota bacterium]
STPATYNKRGYCYLAKKNADEAITDFSMCTLLDYEFVDAYFGRARAYQLKGSNALAVADLQTVISLALNDQGLVQRAKLLISELET